MSVIACLCQLTILVQQVRHGWKIATLLLQLRVLSLGLLQDGDVGVGVFPEREEIFVGGLGFGGVTLQSISAGETEAGECATHEVSHQSAVVDELLKFRCRCALLFFSWCLQRRSGTVAMFAAGVAMFVV
jgi:hypothetical protein